MKKIHKWRAATTQTPRWKPKKLGVKEVAEVDKVAGVDEEDRTFN